MFTKEKYALIQWCCNKAHKLTMFWNYADLYQPNIWPAAQITSRDRAKLRFVSNPQDQHLPFPTYILFLPFHFGFLPNWKSKIETVMKTMRHNILIQGFQVLLDYMPLPCPFWSSKCP